jgi:hypothetical protein
MANSKNTIQNIPLLGQLCLNTLKTDVTQFTDYNEKNSTVFGGELSPMWTKETELGNKDNTYTIFNSKGKAFTLDAEHLYRGEQPDENNVIGTNKFIVKRLCLSDIIDSNVTFAATNVSWYQNKYELIFYYRLGKKVYKKTRSYTDELFEGLSNSNIQVFDGRFFERSGNQVHFHSINEEFDETFYIDNYSSDWSADCAFSSALQTAFLRVGKRRFLKYYRENNTYNKTYVNTYWPMEDTTEYTIDDATTIEANAFNWYSYNAHFDNENNFLYGEFKNCKWAHENALPTGHDGNYKVPGVKGSNIGPSDCCRYYTLNNNLVSINFAGIPIETPFSFADNYLSLCTGEDYRYNSKIYSYKLNDGKWYSTCIIESRASNITVEDLKSLIIDNRYILLLKSNTENKIFDIETETFIEGSNYIGCMFDSVPVTETATDTTTKPFVNAVYGGGFNVGYEINNAKFVGYLPNPYVMTGMRGNFRYWYPSSYSYKGGGVIQTYCTVGNNPQSAEYNGGDSTYAGTYYPIDANGNIILPYNLSARVISGYSCNDLIQTNSVAYPLIYYNNTQKIYSYYLLSAMENVTDTFALQGQRYAVDENNIYSLTFDGGIISNVVAVAYKRNMRYLGTLPTRAIFYSDFNKTFYQFTGDNIISKLFEASDIDKINFVGQNPSSLSLWIATDKGIYILSDTDMFRLEYPNAKDIYFEPKKAIVVTDDGTNNIENDVALWGIDEDMIEHPIKLETKYYGLGSELKANYDCWYIRLHNKDHKAGKLKVKVNTITDISFQTEEKVYNIEPGMYDSNDTIYIRYQPKYQTAVATQLELESDIAIYQISLGVNQTDTVAQQSKFNF